MTGGIITFQGTTVEEFLQLMDERNRTIIKEMLTSATASSQTEIIDRAELLKRLKITEPTCIRWQKKGKIPFLTIGSAIRYNWPAVVQALEKS